MPPPAAVPYATIAADYSFLTANVSTVVTATPSAQATTMLLLGNSFPLARGDPSSLQEAKLGTRPPRSPDALTTTFAAAARVGRGKVVVFGHEGMLVTVVGDLVGGVPPERSVSPGNAVLLANVLRWLLADVQLAQRPAAVAMYPEHADTVVPISSVRDAVERVVSGAKGQGGGGGAHRTAPPTGPEGVAGPSGVAVLLCIRLGVAGRGVACLGGACDAPCAVHVADRAVG